MVIVFVIDNYSAPSNGTIMTAIRFAEGLRERGHTVRIVSNDIENLDEYSFSVKERIIPIVSAVSVKNDMRFAEYDEEVLRSAFEGADVVHFFMPFKVAIEGRKLAERMGIPTTAAYHCQPENISYNIGLGRIQFVNDFIYDKFRDDFYKHIECIHCPSEFIADQLRKYDYHSRMYVISNGVNARYVRENPPRQKEYDIDKKDVFKITMIGRLAPEKRQDLIIDAVNNSKYRDKIEITFAGKGPQKERLERQIETVGLPHTPKMVFLPQEEVLELLYDTDLYVHASDIEIEGISCIEAFASGKVPVISNAKLSATPQFALDERSLFEQGNYMELAARIDYWIEHPEERREMEQRYADLGDKYRIDYSITLAEQMFKDAVSDFKAKQLIAQKKAHQVYKRATSKPTVRNVLGYIIYTLLYPLIALATFLWQGLRIEGRKNFKKIGHNGAVTISNHVHTLDCGTVGMCVGWRKPRFTTIPENFKIPVAGFLVGALGGVPIPRTINENRVFFYELSRTIARKKYVHFYPEGDLDRYNEELRPFKKGAFMLAANAKCPIVPIRLVFRERKGLFKLFSRKKAITAVIGEPIFPDYKMTREQMTQDLMQRAEKAMQELKPKGM